jgi:hypothetical protein
MDTPNGKAVVVELVDRAAVSDRTRTYKRVPSASVIGSVVSPSLGARKTPLDGFKVILGTAAHRCFSNSNNCASGAFLARILFFTTGMWDFHKLSLMLFLLLESGTFLQSLLPL